MNINESLLPEYDNEMSTARRLLERVPMEKASWKPHEKSMSLGRLAGHVAELPSWMKMTLEKDSLDMAPEGNQTYTPPKLDTREELLSFFDNHVAEGRKSLEAATDQVMMSNWTLLAGGKELFTMPKVAVLRTWVLNHLVHHRGQLSVYLRLNEVPVPSIYGPSADDPGM